MARTAKALQAVDQGGGLAAAVAPVADVREAAQEAHVSIRLIHGHKGGFVNWLNRKVVPGQAVECPAELAAGLIASGDFEMVSTDRNQGQAAAAAEPMVADPVGSSDWQSDTGPDAPMV